VKTVGILGLLGVLIMATHSAESQMSPQPAALTQQKEAALKDALFRMREAIDRYYVDKKQYPHRLDSLTAGKYMDRIPSDPFTGSTRSWRLVVARPDRSHPRTAPGIYDVRSGSTATARDGTKYSNW